MVPAPKHGHGGPRRLVWLLLLSAYLPLAGCSRLSAFRSPPYPAFGTETVSHVQPESPEGDLYAERVGRAREIDSPTHRAELARAKRGPVTPSEAAPALAAAETVSPAAASGSLSQVDLQPPVAMQPVHEAAGPVAPAANRAGSGWRPESHDRAAIAAVPVEPKPAAAEVKAPAGPTLDSLLAASRQKLDSLASYQVEMNHQERVNGNLNPAEDVVLSIRRTPKAVRIEWPGGPHKGREVLYASDANNGLMHVKMPDSLKALPRMSMAPDSPLARRSGRHPITEAGLDTILTNMDSALRKQQAGDPSGGKLAYDGLETPPGLDAPAHKITRVTPEGETWTVFLDSATSLPVFVELVASNHDLLERYVFRNLKPDLPELAKVESFDPNARWGPPKGLLQRLARSAATQDDTTRNR